MQMQMHRCKAGRQLAGSSSSQRHVRSMMAPCLAKLAPCRASPPPAAAAAARRGRAPRHARRGSSAAVAAAATAGAAATVTPPQLVSQEAVNQHIREGHYEAPLVQEQAAKQDGEQPSLASTLPALSPGATVDVVVAGCGPAGMALAAQLAQRGLRVGLVGPDAPFVNNYGVWVDEFEGLGLRGTLEREYPDAACFFQEGKETRVGRAYGRVCRRKLRQALVAAAADAGVAYLPASVEGVEVSGDGATATVSCSGGATLTSRLVTLASGQAAGRLLRYEADAPSVAAQTAYGIEADVTGYEAAYDPTNMLFMDYRRHHTGLWDGAARYLEGGNHPNAGEGLWGSSEEVPSFLYAMPLGGSRVFLEETCLVAKPALPFAVLKRRLMRRLGAMGITVDKVHEEEWSYIPVGGPLPIKHQPLTAFGAAANLVHPATGFSVSRSLRQAPEMADAIVAALAAGGGVQAASEAVWDALWSRERRQQAAFHVFGMELLTQLDLGSTNDFFDTFFSLPPFYWRGFLGSSLSSAQLLAFAMLTFAYAPLGIKARLVGHLLADPAGKYLLKRYLGQEEALIADSSSSSSSSGGSSGGGGSSDCSSSSSGVKPSGAAAAAAAGAAAAAVGAQQAPAPLSQP